MTKIQLIDQIRQYNFSVQIAFLNQFDEPALSEYLAALENAHRKTVRLPIWARQQASAIRMVS